MTPLRRELIFKVIDEDQSLIPTMHQLNHYVHCDKFLAWLINNRLTGKNFKEWFKEKHQNSVMSLVQFIIKHSEKNKEVKPLILNKDWIG